MVTKIDSKTGVAGGVMGNGLGEAIHIATVNVRNSRDYSPADPHDIFAEKPWSERKSRLVDALLSTGDVDILGCQEVLHNQLLDLQELLGPTYAHVGVGRDDGKERGEYSPIYYDQTKFELVKWGTIWLSPTPDVVGSRGWDADLPRIATLLTLRHRAPEKGGELVHAVNTHYDHRGLEARAQSSLLIRSQIWQWVTTVEKEGQPSSIGPIVLFGDFNSPSDEAGYQNITAPHPLPSGQQSFTFLDTYDRLQARIAARKSATDSSAFAPPLQSAPYGPAHTYTAFAPPGSREAKRIDFVMLGTDVDGATGGAGRGGWEITGYACLENWVEGDCEGWNGRWSDHRAVRATIARQ
ncbi:hypothetical protein IAT38_000873 [Cryptococcus sp. DSM 104549]